MIIGCHSSSSGAFLSLHYNGSGLSLPLPFLILTLNCRYTHFHPSHFLCIHHSIVCDIVIRDRGKVREANSRHPLPPIMSTMDIPDTPTIKIFLTSITANTEIRKQVQRTVMILEGLRIPFKAIDITKPGMEEERAFMKEKAINPRSKGPPMPPQFFIDNEYLGNYIDFEESVEEDKLEEFLKLTPTLESMNEKKTSEETMREATEDEDDEGEEEEEDEEEGEDEEREDEEGEEEDEEEGEEQEGEGDEEESSEAVATLT
ncbi:hypothetical protein PENTCL1PPCAC_22813, partial [Pristionchus entomophagus]